MGTLLSKALDRLAGVQEENILMLGLDGVGKTTTLFQLQLGEAVCTLPTVGFNVEQVRYKSLLMTVWDIGGQDKIRRLWKHYYEGAHALIFVVDSSDVYRMEEAAKELEGILLDPAMASCGAVLIYANKQDLMDSLPADEMMEVMNLNSSHPGLRGRKWLVQPCCAVSGVGIGEGIEW
eukprot:CAMPEP_0117753904 /NCGR_PEP_ID=MMETSP0947-20121206/12516_1 /TAXON_ID=44440 /ORGANISM="Chattonella subsalsa, Strain CCMP2191" /LENGTH=177 /DNA_ID=CAMNT_0005572901 /DNA_START=193 /DNA_END=723 /DNA_ORIENTATION=+